jgi:hypothetical protein
VHDVPVCEGDIIYVVVRMCLSPPLLPIHTGFELNRRSATGFVERREYAKQSELALLPAAIL